MITVVLSNGDSAEAGSPDAAVYAARLLMQEASEHGASLRLLRATFTVDRTTVRSGVRYGDLNQSTTNGKA